jgi:peptide/nickel transport system permease protein
MLVYLIRRLGQALLVVAVMATLVFVAIYAVGNPIDILASPDADDIEKAAIAKRLGLDLPLWQQFGTFVWNALHGDLGRSFVYNAPAVDVILQRLPATLELAMTGLVFSILIGIPLGMIAGLKPNSLFGRSIMSGSILGFSLPNFWIGLMLILLFAVELRWLPAIGMEGPKSFVLPVATLVISLMPLQIRAVRQSFIETMGEGFVRAGRARGLDETRILGIHVMKVAAVPLVTLIGLQAGYVLGGAIVIESIFNWPGVGNLALQAIQQRDFPMIQGTVLVIAVVYTFVNFLVDLTYAALDPRVKF